jgi:hypothetical protein
MSQSNTKNENVSSSISTKKPLAFVQPVIRDLHSGTNSSRKSMPLIDQEPLSYVSQPRKLPINKLTDFNHHQK